MYWVPWHIPCAITLTLVNKVVVVQINRYSLVDFGLAHDAPVKLYEANKGRAPIVKDHRLHAAQKENVGLHLRILPLCVCVYCVCGMWCFVVCACGVCVFCGGLLCEPVVLCGVVCAFGVVCVCGMWCFVVCACSVVCVVCGGLLCVLCGGLLCVMWRLLCVPVVLCVCVLCGVLLCVPVVLCVLICVLLCACGVF